MTWLDRFRIRVHSNQTVDVNTNGRWPSGKDDLQFFAFLFVVVSSTWIYGLHLVLN